MQLPETAKSMGVQDIFDPKKISWAVHATLGSSQIDLKATYMEVIAGYNAGPGAVAAANGIPFKQTGSMLDA